MPKQIYFKNIPAWRKWLEKNHLKESKIAVIRYKNHTSTPSPGYRELMHEAICFGWIDTTVKRLDADRYLINFSKRTDKSKWSTNTLKYGKELLEAGRMSPYGKQRYTEGLTKKPLDHGRVKNPRVPEDLRKALSLNKEAQDNFNNLAPSYRRTYLYWLEHAKRQETRDKRIATIVQRSLLKKKLFVED